MINVVSIVGRLTKDVDLRYLESGKGVANFTVACNRPFKTNGKQEADFINVVQFGDGAVNTANFMKKGSLIGVTGRIQTRSFEGQNGKVYVTEVVADRVAFLESKKESSNQSNSQSSREDTDPFKDNGEPIDIDESDLPF